MSYSQVVQVYMVEDAEPGVIYTLPTPNGPVKVSFTLKKIHFSNIDTRKAGKSRELWTDEMRDLFHQAVCDLEAKRRIVEPRFIKIAMLDLSKGTKHYDSIKDLTLKQMRSRWQKYRSETISYLSSNKIRNK